jgi:hypothetical protein
VTAAGGLFIREAPLPDADPLVALPFDEQVILLGQSLSGNWYQVQHAEGTGWMASNLLDTTQDCRINLPLVTP